jgi:short-subunit dehydrogenase
MKKIIIVGATSGIGFELTKQYLEKGYSIVGIGRDISKLNDLKSQYPQNLFLLKLDIADDKALHIGIKKSLNMLGGMDIFIMSASISMRNSSLQWELEKKVITINVIGYTAALLSAADFFKKQGHGHLVGISSLTKFFGNKNPAYNATKAFESNYLEGLQYHLSSYPNIYVTDIIPGFIDTPLVAGRDVFWLTPVTKAAKQMISAIDKKKRKIYVSKRWQFFAFILPWFPFKIKKIILSK